jgi:hypothetical protein
MVDVRMVGIKTLNEENRITYIPIPFAPGMRATRRYSTHSLG